MKMNKKNLVNIKDMLAMRARNPRNRYIKERYIGPYIGSEDEGP